MRNKSSANVILWVKIADNRAMDMATGVVSGADLSVGVSKTVCSESVQSKTRHSLDSVLLYFGEGRVSPWQGSRGGGWALRVVPGATTHEMNDGNFPSR